MSVLSFVIPTHNRQDDLDESLRHLSASGAARDCDEVIVVDNASSPPTISPGALPCGTPVRLIREDANIGAAARNTAAHAASGDWLVMLDDDSSPTGELAPVLERAPDDLAALGGEITLPGGGREAGGLPEVIIGCGCAIRRGAFLDAGGYDPNFDYYVEEYDLCAKLIGAGWRIAHTRAIGFEHRKVTTGRDFGRILARLVRNNTWTIARHAPDDELGVSLDAMLERYRRISVKEGVEASYAEARAEAEATIDLQPRTPLSRAGWDRFIGASAVRDSLIPELQQRAIGDVSLITRGKGDNIIERVLSGAGIAIDPGCPRRVVASLSPGPMLDSVDDADGGAIAPYELWSPRQTASTSANLPSTPPTTHS